MKKLPWFPFWAKDFLSSRRVRLMSPEEVGIYTLLLAHEWVDGPLPDDARSLSVLTHGASQEDVRGVLESCFDRTADGWVNDRIEEEREKQLAKHKRRVKAGKKGAEKRWAQQDNGTANGNANAEAMRRQKQPESDTDTEEETTDCEDLWKIWLEELGGDPPHARLTRKRKEKLQALYDECLSGDDDPQAVFRKVLQTVKRSDHHMSERTYQFPESLFLNEERRDRWVTMARNGTSRKSSVSYDRL